jgi:hypothetical protein
MSHNIALPDGQVASTCASVALARASRLAGLGCTRVIELCVGPSLSVLQSAYSRMGISCTGNDIDSRWTRAGGPWIRGDAMEIDISWADAVVFAPPLSAGCTGCRADALCVDAVRPGFVPFMKKEKLPQTVVLVCPARSLATREDRNQLYRLVATCWTRSASIEVVEAMDERGRVRKYTEVWCLGVR